MGQQRTMKFQIDRDNRDFKIRDRKEKRSGNPRYSWEVEQDDGHEDVSKNEGTDHGF